jgi:transcriptional regulator with XRE-family HTH domain
VISGHYHNIAGAMKPLRLLFGERVRTLRVQAGLTQDEFAEKCGFARSYMSRIETGGANPSLDAIEVLATALKVQVIELLQEPPKAGRAS